MRAARLASWSLLVGGLASIGYAGLQGDLDVYLLVVVPVVAGTGPWAALGLLGAIVGLIGLAWTGRMHLGGPPGGRGAASEDAVREREGLDRSAERQTSGGGVILIGPIPIAWGSDRSALAWLVGLGLLLTVVAVALTFILQP